MSRGREIIGANRDIPAPNTSKIPEYTDSSITDLSEELLELNIRIGEFRLQKNLREVLYFGCDDLTDKSDLDIDKALHASSEFRVSVGIAYAHLQQAFDKAEQDFFIFEMQELETAHRRVIDHRRELHGKLTQSMMSVTKDERFAELFRVKLVKQSWMMLKDKIGDLKRDLTILKKVDSALEMRTTFLMGIAKRRFTERTNTIL